MASYCILRHTLPPFRLSTQIVFRILRDGSNKLLNVRKIATDSQLYKNGYPGNGEKF